MHLGNYLGAVLNWSRMQNGYECYFGLVDQHAITVPIEPARLRAATLDLVAWYLACGLDPARAHISCQSHVIGHTELHGAGCLCPLGQLERMTQFKDKSAKQEKHRRGLLFYPVLMAADICSTTRTQCRWARIKSQHLELRARPGGENSTAHIPTVKVPEPYIAKTGARRGLALEPGEEMSKSDDDAPGTLYLSDPPNVLRKNDHVGGTDSGSEVTAREDKPV